MSRSADRTSTTAQAVPRKRETLWASQRVSRDPLCTTLVGLLRPRTRLTGTHTRVDHFLARVVQTFGQRFPFTRRRVACSAYVPARAVRATVFGLSHGCENARVLEVV